MEIDIPERGDLIAAARAARARAEAHERNARAERAQLGDLIRQLLDLGGTSQRALARELDYASENSVRTKAARQG